MITQKTIDASKDNIMVRVVFLRNKTLHECVGVLIKSSDGEIEVSFNVVDTIIRDSIHIPQKDIVGLKKIQKIETYET